MASTEWLLDRGFRLASGWETSTSIVHRVPWLRHKAGVYAFVVDSEVRYLGKADVLHRRLRNYSARTFGVPTDKPPRRVHGGIRDAVAGGSAVSVYVLLIEPGATRTAGQTEAELICEIRPPWNGTDTKC